MKHLDIILDTLVALSIAAFLLTACSGDGSHSGEHADEGKSNAEKPDNSKTSSCAYTCTETIDECNAYDGNVVSGLCRDSGYCCHLSGSGDADIVGDTDTEPIIDFWVKCKFQCVGYQECELSQMVFSQVCDSRAEICCDIDSVSGNDQERDGDGYRHGECQFTCVESWGECAVLDGKIVDQACSRRREICCDLKTDDDTDDGEENDEDVNTDTGTAGDTEDDTVVPCEYTCVGRGECEEDIGIRHADQTCDGRGQTCCELTGTDGDTDADTDTDTDTEVDTDIETEADTATDPRNDTETDMTTDTVADCDAAPSCNETCDFNDAICKALGGTIIPDAPCENSDMVCCDVPE